MQAIRKMVSLQNVENKYVKIIIISYIYLRKYTLAPTLIFSGYVSIYNLDLF